MNEQKKILFYEEGFFEKSIQEYDPILSSYLDEEKKRQQNQIEMIASENFVSRSVLEAHGSNVTNSDEPFNSVLDNCETKFSSACGLPPGEVLALAIIKLFFTKTHPTLGFFPVVPMAR